MIKHISLTDFRNFTNKKFNFSKDITVIVGPNAAGKTNILESLFLLSTGKSFKAKIEEEMINYDSDIARVKGSLLSGLELECVMTRGLIDIGAERPEKVARKRLLVNGVGKRMIDFSGNFKTTLFGPWDMDLVTESPSIRRRFLDTVLSQIDREYRRCTLSYDKGLRQRNRLLWRIREEGLPRSQLLFWNQLLIKNGDYITQKRAEFIEFVNSQSMEQEDKSYKLEYDRSIISEGRLEQYKDEEVASATTLVGPHRDDIIFFEGKRNLSSYGSRGEQRMGVLWIKMAELNFIEEKTSERPTLLLDDIFSELDHNHREIVMKLAERQQTVITTADEHFLEGLKAVGVLKL
jgi:DNA replication and repair protein RecF